MLLRRRRSWTREVSDEEVARAIRGVPEHFSNIQCCCKCCTQYTLPSTVYLHYDAEVTGLTVSGCLAPLGGAVYQTLPNPIPMATIGNGWRSACFVIATLSSVNYIDQWSLECYAPTSPCTGYTVGNCRAPVAQVWALTNDQSDQTTANPASCGGIRCAPLFWVPDCAKRGNVSDFYGCVTKTGTIGPPCSTSDTGGNPATYRLTNVRISNT